MAKMPPMPDTEVLERFSSRAQYVRSLSRFDAALCEGCAVSQATSGQFVHPSLGYATHVFARILAHGRNLIRSMPWNRWGLIYLTSQRRRRHSRHILLTVHRRG